MTTVLGLARPYQQGIVQRIPTDRQVGIIKHEYAVPLYPFKQDDLIDPNEIPKIGEKVFFKVDRRGYATRIKPQE